MDRIVSRIAAAVAAFFPVLCLSCTGSAERIVVPGNRFVLVNNTWNAQAIGEARFKQRVFMARKGALLGWTWDWPRVTASVVSYPEVVCGDKPWDPPSGLATEFPLAIGSATITANFDAKVEASGVYNMAFSLWVLSGLPNEKKNITHEIMIWTVKRGLEPAGAWESSPGIDGRAWDLFVRRNHGDASGGSDASWTYAAFVAREPIMKGPLRVEAFAEYLVSTGLIPAGSLLSSLELGNEIVSGKGRTELRGYEVTVEAK